MTINSVFGETNLYNEAVLLLTIRNEQGITCGQDKVEVKIINLDPMYSV